MVLIVTVASIFHKNNTSYVYIWYKYSTYTHIYFHNIFTYIALWRRKYVPKILFWRKRKNESLYKI